jgi:hypothetical protein
VFAQKRRRPVSVSPRSGEVLGWPGRTVPASGRFVQWDGVDVYRLSDGKISNIWAGDDWTAILNDTGTFKAPLQRRGDEHPDPLVRRQDHIRLGHHLTG